MSSDGRDGKRKSLPPARRCIDQLKRADNRKLPKRTFGAGYPGSSSQRFLFAHASSFPKNLAVIPAICLCTASRRCRNYPRKNSEASLHLRCQPEEGLVADTARQGHRFLAVLPRSNTGPMRSVTMFIDDMRRLRKYG